VADNPFDQFDAPTTTPAPVASGPSASANPFDQFDTEAPPAPTQAPPTQDDINDHLQKMLADPKTSGKDIRDFYSSFGSQLPENVSRIIDQRDQYIAANHSAPTIGVDIEHPIGNAGGLVDNRPYSFMEGVRQGDQHILSNVAGAAGWLGNKAGLDNNWADGSRDYFRNLEAPETTQGSSGGKLVGEIIGTAPLALATAPLEGVIAGAGVPLAAARGLSTIADGALQSAVASNSRTPTGVLEDAGIGGGASFLGSKLLNPVAAAIAPNLSASAQALRNLGVRLTPGQLAEGTLLGNGLRKIEDTSTHLPLFGDILTNARQTANRQLNTGVANDALSHIDQTLPSDVAAGHDAVGATRRAISQHYDDAYSRATLANDPQLMTDLTAARQNATNGVLSGDAGNQLNASIDSVVDHRLGNSGLPLPGDQVAGMLRDLNSRISAATDPAYKSSLRDVRSAVNDAISRQSGPDVANDLSNAGAAWQKYSIMRNAASKATDGVYSPGQLSTAVRMGDSSIAKGASAEGDAPLQNISNAARSIMPSRVGDSGTAGRNLINGLTVGAGAVGHSAVAAHPAGLASLAAASAIYSPWGLRAVNAVYGRNPGESAQALRALFEHLTPKAIGTLTTLSNDPNE
jgi:hypothetical protein